MHRLRRKLSEPRNAGHKTAASLCSQRMTSDANSESICSMPNMCPQTHGHIKKMQQENCEKPAILKDKLRFATETSLVRVAQHGFDHLALLWRQRRLRR